MNRRSLLRALALTPWLATLPIEARSRNGASLLTVFGRLPPPEGMRRVFAAGPPAAVLTAVLAPRKLLGWPAQLGTEARETLSMPLGELPVVGRLAGRGSTVSAETLLVLKPDLILDVGTVSANYLSSAQRVAEQTGLPYVLVDGRLTDSARQLREVGHLLGVGAHAEVLAAYADRMLAHVARLHASVALEQRPRVYYGRGADGLETGLDGSINMEAIDMAGGRNVAASAGRGGITRVSLEQILAWAPEVIVAQDARFARRVLDDPLWRAAPAVRAKRVLSAPAVPFGWLESPPGVNRLIGVRWLLERLHPGARAQVAAGELRQATAEFYRLFYGIEVAGSALDRLLEGAA